MRLLGRSSSPAPGATAHASQFTAVYLPDTSYGCGQSVQTLYIAPIRPGSSSTQ